ncbi:MAG: S8 family serine peptidase [Ignavibacteriaceae bacterium]|nr:S8 family serine peptidase [Ignavibacteriaceae bacterium]
MKKVLLFVVLMAGISFSQGQLFTNNGTDEVVKLDPRMQQSEFVPGEILVKFKDEISVRLLKTNGTSSVGISSVDQVLQKYNASSAEKLFPQAERIREKQMLKTFGGQEFERPSLHNIYKLQIELHDQIFQAIEELKADENVVYAEPNYIMSVVESEPLSPELTESEMIEWLKEHPLVQPNTSNNQFQPYPQSPKVVTPNDPLYSQQWGIPATQVDAVWDSTTGDTTQIIAILDTGVDWLHPDLKDNIWINWAEANGVAGVDDDGNGKIDDIRGWDWINNDNDPKDDNSHGTHVAGIAAAKGNNGLGIAGVNWNAKIMVIKVFQSSGRGDAATITQGIVYAKNKGATVINMSFGSYARSLTMEDALANAYATTILVAAAGNDNYYIGPLLGCERMQPHTFFPAALTYVLGVKDKSRCGLNFSNYDEDPIYSDYYEQWNYEVTAPGSGILSSVPNGNYRIYSGTSMSAPMVAGVVLHYKKIKHEDSQELMWGNIIYSSEPADIACYQGFIKALDFINIIPIPKISLVTVNLSDTLDGDGDGRVDAGETIDISLKVKNTWGQTDSVFVGVRFNEFEDTTTAHIIKKEAFIGSISPYSTRKNELNPLRIKISPNVVHDRDIKFEVYLSYYGSSDTIFREIIFNVENGAELSGMLDDTLVLTKDKNWIVRGSYKITPTGVLLIKAGTHLQIDTKIVNDGKIIGEGTKDSIININGTMITTTYIGTTDGRIELNYANVQLDYMENNRGTINGQKLLIRNSTIQLNGWYGLLVCSGEISESILHSWMVLQWYIIPGGPLLEIKNSNIIRMYNPVDNFGNAYFNSVGRFDGQRMKFSYNNMYNIGKISTLGGGVPFSKSNNIIGLNNREILLADGGYFQEQKNQYWGTADSMRIENKIFDFMEDASLAKVVFSPYLKQPTDSAHAIVWKVLVNGKDAQDEYVEPVGVGPQRFNVYFSKSMDTTFTPFLSFGVRLPYTQKAVIDSSTWSPDGKVWTAYHTIKVYTGDGINRLRVSSARDLDGWEIPVEDQRFEFLIDAAGSASTEFMATAGLGKVNLEWRNPESVPDLLGYNMYRFEHLTDTTFTTPIQANSSLVTDTLFTDFEVIPNKKYYYYYKVVRTDFSESDSSRITNATPFTAAIGDANGDLDVSVLDILSEVSYILGQNPQPFIFDAADVARDSVINVLDVVGTVNIIMGGKSMGKYFASQSYGNAKLELINNKLMLTTDVPLSGIQVKLKGSEIGNLQFINHNISGFENAQGNIGDTSKIIMYYNLNNNELPAGSYELGRLEGITGNVYLTEAVLADKNGNNVLTNVVDNGVPLIPTEYYLDQNFPNPFNAQTIIQYGVPEKAAGRINIYNILGQRVKTFELGEMAPGRYRVQWDGRNNYGISIASGVYIYRFETKNYITAKKLLLLK